MGQDSYKGNIHLSIFWTAQTWGNSISSPIQNPSKILIHYAVLGLSLRKLVTNKCSSSNQQQISSNCFDSDFLHTRKLLLRIFVSLGELKERNGFQFSPYTSPEQGKMVWRTRSQAFKVSFWLLKKSSLPEKMKSEGWYLLLNKKLFARKISAIDNLKIISHQIRFLALLTTFHDMQVTVLCYCITI